MAFKPALLFVVGMALVSVTQACGSADQLESEHHSKLYSSSFELASDPSVLNDVSLADRTGFTASVNPSYLPKAGETSRDLEITFYPKLTVKNANFVYDSSKWTVAVGNNVQFLTGADIIDIKEDGNFASGEIREGQVKLTVRLTTQGQWPDKITNDAALTTNNGRKALKLLPYYSLDGAVAPGNSGTLQGVSAVFMQDDIGAIQAPAKITSTAVSDSAFSVEFTAPEDTTAFDTSDGTLKNVGSSNVSGFVVVYWRDSECQSGGWSFKANEVYDKNETGADLQCSYPGLTDAVSGAESCNLGCSTSVAGELFDKSANDVAIPLELPTGTGSENEIQRGCLRVARVRADGRTSYAVNNAINDENYGVMVYPLDSSGRIGSMRSTCSQLKPINVEFVSSRKTPGLGKTKSDCFVATAASGSTQSAAVHYWRILRDTWLDPLGLSVVYYRYAQSWARWLDAHPQYKPALNKALEWSGQHLVSLSQWLSSAKKNVQSFTQTLAHTIGSILFPEARADDSTQTNSDEGLENDHGSASSTLTFGGGQIRPSADKELYDISYKDKKPLLLFVGQSFRVFDLMGELGLGYEFAWLSLDGTSADASKTPVTLSGYGISALLEYRLRFGQYPWVAPRFAYTYGRMRMREEAQSVSDSGSASDAASSSQISVSGTKPAWHNQSGLKAYFDVSVPALFGDDLNLIRYGYGVEDMTLSVFAGQNINDGSLISTSGLQLGGAISFMFK